MEWRVWITRWIIFWFRCSRTFWSDIKKNRGKTGKNTGEKTDNFSKMIYIYMLIYMIYVYIYIYIYIIEKLITIKIKTGYYLQLLTPEMMKLLGSTKSKVTKDDNGENVLHLQITEAVLLHCNIVNNDYQHDSRVLRTFVPNKSFTQLLDISSKNFIF